ncbi:MAG: hypothetical protein HKO75_07055 [Flavobacteriaceae bacterium]|nr:hypothetical protein [Muriicola sp.]NNL39604.1 hypothetical protein [Flavobacteriaceae bacterium]
MKTLCYLLLIPFFLTSCEPDTEIEIIEPIESRTTFFSYDFMVDQYHPDFEVILLDSLQNYGELIRKMQRLSCNNKRIGIQFSVGDTLYGLTGFTDCPEVEIIDCYSRINIFVIKNDSLKNIRELNRKKSMHISELSKVIDRIQTEPLRYQFRRNALRLTLLNLYIDPKHPISMTKEVLKEVATAFKEVNTEMGPDFFKYNILFEDNYWMYIPPPPPPPAAME